MPNRISEIRKKIGLSLHQVAELGGISHQSVFRAEANESNPTQKTLHAIATAFSKASGRKYTVDDLLYSPSDLPDPKDILYNIVELPEYERPPMAESDKAPLGTHPIPELLAGKCEYVLRQYDDSMSERPKRGDLLLVEPAQDAENGEVVIAITDDGDWICRRVHHTHKAVVLSPTNPNYPPAVAGNGTQIVGVVRQFIGKP